MQNKGAIKALAIIFGVIFLYQLSFTVVTKVYEKRAHNRAQELVFPQDKQTDQALPVSESVQKMINKEIEEAAKRGELLNEEQAKVIVADSLERFYLDSISNKPVYNLLFKKYTFNEVKKNEINLGLDLKGGMSLTLKVTEKEIVEGLAGEDALADPSFQKAIEYATSKSNEGSDFIDLFIKEYEDIQKAQNADPSLARFFSFSLKESGITDDSKNSEISAALTRECNEAFDRSFQILRTRIDRFGVAQPNIQKLEGSRRILVELPGIKDTKRVRELLQKTAQLEFWETYTVREIAEKGYFKTLNDRYAEVEKGLTTNEENVEPKTTTDTESPTELEEEPSEEDLAQASDTTKQDQGDLSDLIDNNGENISENEAVTKNLAENPLLGRLIPRSNNPETSCIGLVQVSDKAKVNEIVRFGMENAILPPDMKLVWSAKPEIINGEEFYELIALKMTSNAYFNASSNGCVLDGGVIINAKQDYDQQNNVEVEIVMNTDGTNRWSQITKDNIGKEIAIVLDELVYSHPVVNTEITGGRSVISGGGMTIEEGQDLANILKAGKLPARITVLSDEVVGPSLGKESVNKGMWSMIFAFILVLVYMVFFYKKSGMVANIALIVNVFFLFGVLACLGAVLTLPGIAGIVLTLGMAVDSNVIIFERIKEEIRGGKGLRLAIDAGYKNAYSAIIDGNVTTLITGIVLIVLGSGPVHSFAVTLCIGILTSLFTSIFITRLIFTRMLDKEKNISFTTKFTENFLKDKNFDFIKFRKTAYIIACVMIVISVGSLCFKGLNLGIDFKGGRNYIVRFDSSDVKIEDVRKALATADVEGWEKPEVKTYGRNGQFKITTKYMIDNDAPEVDANIQGILYKGLKGLFKEEISEDNFASKNSTIGIVHTQKVGGTIASDVTRNSIWAIIVSLLLMFGYIAIRFRKWQYGLSALAALTHDTVIMLGMYSLFFNVLPFTMEVDQAFIAAVLTIIGYSINATVVIFDRVRENTTLHPKASWKENINGAVNSTLTRSFNTSGSTFIVLLAIFIFGGDTIRGFIFALLVGILAGTFSSVFLSSPIAYNLIGGQKQEKQLAETTENENTKKKK